MLYGVTVRVVTPLTAFEVATTSVEPAAIPAACPFVPAALLMVATPMLDELQVTVPVRSLVLLSLYVPVAVNCWVLPDAIVGVAGVTAIEMSAATPVPLSETLCVPPPSSATDSVAERVPAAAG